MRRGRQLVREVSYKENSSGLAFGALFLACLVGQAIAGQRVYNQQQLDYHAETIGWLSYLGNPGFWETTLQNWQSEFLAVGSFAVFAILLRQRGSPESKPVGAAHTDAGLEG